ncbi:MAG: hypothetical protein ABL908_18250, partial [Hyphomicrobium sp.]
NVAVRAQGVLTPSEPVQQVAEQQPTEKLAGTQRDDTRIVMSRTETISIPATAASLPAAFARSGFAKVAAADKSAVVMDFDVVPEARLQHVMPEARFQREAPTIVLPGPDSRPATIREPIERVTPLQIEVVSADDIKTLRRFAPGAAE